MVQFQAGQLVLVSIPGLGYQNVPAEVIGEAKPVGTSKIFILADRRHREVWQGNHPRIMPNQLLRLATREEIVAGLSVNRKQFRMWMPSAKRLVAIGDGWGFERSQ
jgi:hypothetical protein